MRLRVCWCSYTSFLLLLTLLAKYSSGQSEVEWSDWSDWSNCSRPCGGGVLRKDRECIKLVNDTEEKCLGPAAIYKMCNIQDCPEGTVDFRMQQCSKYDRTPHKGKYYRWAGFHHNAGECELKCMPKGEFFYVTFSKKVIDGTPCNPYSEDVCIDGKCVKVGCDKQLYSNARLDNCGVCNGNGASCKLVQSEFQIKQNAYGYLHVVTIPAGATNIKVYEIGVISSYIALKRSGSYILNGERLFEEQVKTLLDGKTMAYTKTTLKNELTISGPTNLPLQLHVFVVDGPKGNRIRYEYYTPPNTPPQVDQTPRYGWTKTRWSQCSKTCSTGQRTRQISCRNLNRNTEVQTFYCEESKKPVETEACNMGDCPPEWYISQWSPCSKTCGEGTRTRRVNCITVDKEGETVMVDFSRCKGTAAPRVEKCVEQDECPTWSTGEWSECSQTCGTGVQRRSVTCAYALNSNSVEEEKCSKEDKPIEARECFEAECGALWVVGSWTKCSTHCGVGMRSRPIACKTSEGIEVPTRYCDKDEEPKHFEECKVQGPCRPVWYASQWSQCSGKCGNGMQMRNVYCVELAANQMYMVNERTCVQEDKPKALKRCEGMKPCHVNYFASKWSKCSAECGPGVRVREVRCYADRRINHSGEACASLRKPSSHEICEIKACGSTNNNDSDLERNPVVTVDKDVESQKTKARIVSFVGPENLRENEDADYSCIVEGNPRPQTQFLLNGKIISSSRFRVTQQNNGARLTILTAFTVDSGELTCIAGNTLGVSSKILKLEVIEPPKARIVPPSAVRQEDDSYVIICEVKGKANPRVQWTKDGVSFQGDITRVSIQERRIYFRRLITADTGRYRCTAFNAAGSGTGEVRLTVNKKPEVKTESCFDNYAEADCRKLRDSLRFLCSFETYKKSCCETCRSY